MSRAAPARAALDAATDAVRDRDRFAEQRPRLLRIAGRATAQEHPRVPAPCVNLCRHMRQALGQRERIDEVCFRGIPSPAAGCRDCRLRLDDVVRADSAILEECEAMAMKLGGACVSMRAKT